MRPRNRFLAFDRRSLFERLDFFLLFSLVVVGAMSAAAQIPLVYTNDNGAITITKYTGDGGAVSIPETIDGLPVMHIGPAAFYETTWRLDDVTIPDSVKSIGESAFRHCFGLTNVTLGRGVTNIGNDAFSSSALAGIVVPDNVITVGERAFFSSQLATASIGNGVTTIGKAAFGFCSALKNISIGRNVTQIGSMAFGYCTSLEGVYFAGNAFTLDSKVFETMDKTIIYYLPGTTGWSSTFDGRQTRLWNPKAVIDDANFGVQAGQFSFTISGSTNLVVIVEACSDLSNPVWIPVGTNVLANGSATFSGSGGLDYGARIYRLRSP